MKIGILFPGYGGQFVGMGKELYDESRIMQEYFEEASNCLNINFVKLCFASSDAEISKIDNALVANFLVNAALYALLREQGIIPFMVTGHSSGIYAAIFAAGGISLPDMLYMLNKYTTSYQELLTSTPMKAIRIVGLERDELVKLCLPYAQGDSLAFVSVYESNVEHVVSGHAHAVEQIHHNAQEAGAKRVIELDQVEGLHSVLMKPVQENVLLYSEKVDFKELQVPLTTSTNAKTIMSKEDVKAAMMDQIVQPIHWDACVATFSEYDLLIEVGPGTTLSDKLRKIYPEKTIIAINKTPDLSKLQELLKPTADSVETATGDDTESKE